MKDQNQTSLIENIRLTPNKAIRAYCLWCCAGSKKEVRLCNKVDCELHQFRLGNNPYHKNIKSQATIETLKEGTQVLSPGDKSRSPVKCIRNKCLDCSGGSTKEVNHCPFKDCDLFPYRMGKNPYHMNSKFNSFEKIS